MRPITRRLARASLVSAVALGALASVLLLAARGDDHQSKPRPPALAEPAARTPDDDGATVPVEARGTTALTCAGGWTPFANPVVHYGLCIPPGWGFSDFTTTGPMTDIPRRMLNNLHLLSADAFPWTPGDFPFDLVRERGVVDVELNLLPSDAPASTECEPADPRRVGTLTFLTCAQAYDDLGQPAEAGDVYATKIVVPLVTTPERIGPGPSLAGARLLVIVRTARPMTEEVSLPWRVVDSIRPL
ncbi:MAG TPA: hypothetical protein VGB83_12820 [Actinomycetota bacterium]